MIAEAENGTYATNDKINWACTLVRRYSTVCAVRTVRRYVHYTSSYLISALISTTFGIHIRQTEVNIRIYVEVKEQYLTNHMYVQVHKILSRINGNVAVSNGIHCTYSYMYHYITVRTMSCVENMWTVPTTVYTYCCTYMYGTYNILYVCSYFGPENFGELPIRLNCPVILYMYYSTVSSTQYCKEHYGGKRKKSPLAPLAKLT